ncbi:MAG: radical SAM protein [Clostridiales bacterium]|nr:radical SAM protein [Clostridiales bacterium]
MKNSNFSSFEDYKNYVLEKFKIDDEYIVCGIGRNFRGFIKLFPELKIEFCLDKNAKNINAENYKIYSYDYLNSLDESDKKNKKIIVAPSCEFFTEIKGVLLSYGIKAENIISSFDLMCIWGAEYKNKFFASACNVILLTHCNLKCRACTQFTPYVKKLRYNTPENVIESIDNYFKIYDFVYNIVPVGGETMLYKELADICEYIDKNYSDRYCELQLFSNGLLKPQSEKTLERLAKIKNLRFLISDYSSAVKDKKLVLPELLDKYNINYTLNNNFGQSYEERWFDLGNPEILKGTEESEYRNRFEKCSLLCQNLIDSKLYYCVPRCFAEIGGIYNSENSKDFIDLKELQTMDFKEKADVIGKFSLGYFEKGYLDFCRYCNGFGEEINNNYVLAGEQYKK